jgi:hypothetical protein
MSKLERIEHFANSIQRSETLPPDKPATAKHVGDQCRMIRQILSGPNPPQFPIKYRVREDPPAAGEADIENSRAGLLAHAEQHRAAIKKVRFAPGTRISR